MRQSSRVTFRGGGRTAAGAEPALDRLSTAALVATLHAADAGVAAAVGRVLPALERAVDAAAARWRAGGRLLYAGAGTSGRLAALDAAELPPTFGIPAARAQALLAGGRGAFARAREGAEDDTAAARAAMRRLRLRREDIVIGVAASGRTPFTMAAVRAARRAGALTIALACTPGSPLGRAAEIAIEPDTGPERLPGSTRLKAGTAQKMALNLFSTALMIRTGHVYGSWMTGVRATNAKLRARALEILSAAGGVSAARARALWKQAQGDLRLAIVLAHGHDAADARRRLRRAGGNLRQALEMRDGTA